MGTKIKMDIKQLMCRLTEEELEQESKHLTGLLTEKMNLEIEKSSSARHYSDAIKSVDLKIEKQIPIVRDRQIERDVECRTEFNTPEPGKKTVTNGAGAKYGLEKKYDAIDPDLIKNRNDYDAMSIEELQVAILEKMASNGPVNDQMIKTVMDNVYPDSLKNWVKSFR